MKYLLLLSLLFSTAAIAQPPQGERVKAFKTAHITNALDLTSAEAEKFWPIYNAHEEKLAQLRKKERQEIFQIVKGDVNALTNEEADAIIEKGLNFKQTEFNLHKKLITDLRGVIPSKKIVKLHRAEEEFKRILLNRMKNRQNRRNK